RERQQIAFAYRRDCRRWKSSWYRSKQSHALPAKVEEASRDDSKHHGCERSRSLRRQPFQDAQNGEERRSDNQRRHVGLPKFADELSRQTKETRWSKGETEQPAKLAGDDAQRDAVQVAGENRAGEEVCQKAKTAQPGGDAKHAGNQRKR